ncbi:MAG: O-antigen ligase family protein [Chloroflexota bacterium]
MQDSNALQNWITRLDRRTYGALIGVVIGLVGGIVALMLAIAGPVITFGAILGLLAGLYVLSNTSAALYGVIFVATLLPFGTLPFKIAITPTFIDVAMGAFLIVYLFQWMTGRRQQIRLTPVHALIALYMLWLILAFALGLRFALPKSADIRQFAETLLSIGMVFILVDLLREPQALRRLVQVVMIAITLQAIITLILYVMPDDTAERTLVRLARIGYPNGGVIRYVEDNPALSERAIGTWVDPNALGGILAVSAAMIAPQVFARKPIIRYRWIILGVLGLVTLALILTFSRASMLAFGIGVGFIATFKGYRRFVPMILLGACLLLLLPQTRSYIERFGQAFTGSDLATQMRLGEYGDSFKLISQYPVFGVGFTGTPQINLYTDVASMYLIMANQIGLVGVGIYAVAIISIFVYGWRARRYSATIPELESIHLGYHAALLTALINATADLYFFRLDFQASITIFWLVVALALASSRLTFDVHESTVAKSA